MGSVHSCPMFLAWLHAFFHSCHGFCQAWQERAFRQELVLFAVSLPAAIYLGQTWLEQLFLIACGVLVLITEVLNTAIERTVNRIGLETNPLSKQAKDLGSAAVLLALIFWLLVWVIAAYRLLCIH
jgi:diacylglycerol kinase (ATP)